MYQTLYRKYRPQTFSDIVGQDIIVKILKNSILNNKIGHAYLFIGPRGTGKTSTAKIFARAVNCLNNNAGDLCNNCNNCITSSNNDCLDIIEIDAASNNSVDEIRNLKEKVNLVPTELKYKVYIIDEVHMLTIQAFNALLKTLEEPPEHIIFILATTDPQKVPETITSRCQSFNFCRINENSIVENLKKISKNEKINIENDVLNQIALLSDGGMRDSIGMLDKLSSYTNEKITLDDFIKISGLVTTNDLDLLLEKVVSNNIPDTIEIFEKWNNEGNNIIQIMIQLLDYLKTIIIKSYIEKNNNEIVGIYKDLANLINSKMFEIRQSSNPKIYIEIMIINFISNNEKIISQEIISSEKNNKIIEKQTKKVTKEDTKKKIIKEEKPIINNKAEHISLVPSNIEDIINIRVNNTFVDATKEKLNKLKEEIKKMEQFTFDLDIGYLACSLLEGNIRLASDKYMVISYKYDSSVNEYLEYLEKLENLLKEKLGENLKIAIISDEKWEKYANEFLENKNKNIKYEYKEEIEQKFDNINKKYNKTSNLNEFSDILEVA